VKHVHFAAAYKAPSSPGCDTAEKSEPDLRKHRNAGAIHDTGMRGSPYRVYRPVLQCCDTGFKRLTCINIAPLGLYRMYRKKREST
jgi:hypothetical protein